MSNRSGKIEHVFVGEGHYDLHLRIDELIQLQEKLNAGPMFVATRFASGEWMVDDVRQTIRLALIGGGLHPREAHALVENHIVSGYLNEYALIAQEVLFAACVGVEDEPIDDDGEDGETPGESITPLD